MIQTGGNEFSGDWVIDSAPDSNVSFSIMISGDHHFRYI